MRRQLLAKQREVWPCRLFITIQLLLCRLQTASLAVLALPYFIPIFNIHPTFLVVIGQVLTDDHTRRFDGALCPALRPLVFDVRTLIQYWESDHDSVSISHHSHHCAVRLCGPLLLALHVSHHSFHKATDAHPGHCEQDVADGHVSGWGSYVLEHGHFKDSREHRAHHQGKVYVHFYFGNTQGRPRLGTIPAFHGSGVCSFVWRKLLGKDIYLVVPAYHWGDAGMLIRCIGVQRRRSAVRIRISAGVRKLQHLLQEDYAFGKRWREPVLCAQARQTESPVLLVWHGVPPDDPHLGFL